MKAVRALHKTADSSHDPTREIRIEDGRHRVGLHGTRVRWSGTEDTKWEYYLQAHVGHVDVLHYKVKLLREMAR